MSLQERIFFKGVREGLTSSLGVESLEALQQAQEITLHPLIFEKHKMTYNKHLMIIGNDQRALLQEEVNLLLLQKIWALDLIWGL